MHGSKLGQIGNQYAGDRFESLPRVENPANENLSTAAAGVRFDSGVRVAKKILCLLMC
jgi:hypothetical protein